MRGVVRFISSAMRISAKTGPGLNTKSSLFRSKIFIPVISPGSRSGVNCTRFAVPSTETASALAMLVFPVPGMSSSRT